jgi:hypothetical protein
MTDAKRPVSYWTSGTNNMWTQTAGWGVSAYTKSFMSPGQIVEIGTPMVSTHDNVARYKVPTTPKDKAVQPPPELKRERHPLWFLGFK